jgi:hypothetical protein
VTCAWRHTLLLRRLPSPLLAPLPLRMETTCTPGALPDRLLTRGSPVLAAHAVPQQQPYIHHTNAEFPSSHAIINIDADECMSPVYVCTHQGALARDVQSLLCFCIHGADSAVRAAPGNDQDSADSADSDWQVGISPLLQAVTA